MNSETAAVLLDTDIGSDIDDAVCLAYLLCQPRCELAGITTVSGDTAKRAALAALECEAAGRPDIPVHAGAPGPILFGPGQPEVQQYATIARKPHRKDFAPHSAVPFMRKIIRSRPGEITLLAIGPLTNVGLLFAMDPEIPGLLRRLVLMCGMFLPRVGMDRFDEPAGMAGPGDREWNAHIDPVAAGIVFNSRPPKFMSVGMEVTTRCRLPAEECRRRFAAAGGPLAVVAEYAAAWTRPYITFHDPLAGAVIFEPEICEYKDGSVKVETASRDLAGLTKFWPDADGNPHRIASGVDVGRFFEHFFETVGNAGA